MLQEGFLRFIIVEGKLGSVSVKGAENFDPERMKKSIRLKPGEVIQEGVLVGDINFLNRNPFRHVDLIYTPGEATGTTDI